MIDTRTAPYAALIMRLTLGTMFVAHALLKLFVFTLPGTVQFFESLGLPGALTLAEALRFVFPFEGVPLASLGIGQAAGPLTVYRLPRGRGHRVATAQDERQQQDHRRVGRAEEGDGRQGRCGRTHRGSGRARTRGRLVVVG